MNNLYINTVIVSIFIIGMWSFISGQFIISTVLFGIAAIFSNMVKRVDIDG